MNTPEDITLRRLDDQIVWYDGKSNRDQRSFKLYKGAELIAAAAIPFVAMLNVSRTFAAFLGVFIVVVEGMQSLNQFQANWIGYRSTCEALKHEKYLYLAKAGDYASAADPRALLAERIEALVSHEHAKWVSGRQEVSKLKQGINRPIGGSDVQV